ncbi:MAG: hypothetical protein JXA08_04110 [Methanomicrobiaceae archaeon]|nr:hypothetical protein [Methanomicrobiaceae archaeon]
MIAEPDNSGLINGVIVLAALGAIVAGAPGAVIGGILGGVAGSTSDQEDVKKVVRFNTS